MRVSTSPNGIVYESGFYAGSREEVNAKYTASCCNSKVHLSAVDLNGNVMSYDIDVSRKFEIHNCTNDRTSVMMIIVCDFRIFDSCNNSCDSFRGSSFDCVDYCSHTCYKMDCQKKERFERVTVISNTKSSIIIN